MAPNMSPIIWFAYEEPEFSLTLLFVGFSSDFSNKMKQMKQQKVTEFVNAVSSEPQTFKYHIFRTINRSGL